MKVNTKNLELLLAKSCMTNEELARVTGLEACTITRIKKGHQNPRLSTIGKIAKALNVSVEDIIEGGE